LLLVPDTILAEFIEKDNLFILGDLIYSLLIWKGRCLLFYSYSIPR